MLFAQTIDELQSQLPAINVIVLPRSERTKDQIEVYSIVRLLGTLRHASTDFPIRMEKRERPDFLLEFGARKIGVEHVEAISENAAKEASIRSEGHGPEIHFVRPTSIEEQRKPKKQIINEINENRGGPPWEGELVEVKWSAAMAHFIAKKVRIANVPGFERFEENWLLIYDNWPAPALQREKAVLLLRSQLGKASPWHVFSRVFILDETKLLEISPISMSYYQVNHSLGD